MDDRPQHRVDLTQRGKVVGGLVERAELGLAAASLVEDGADPQGEGAGTFELGDDLGVLPAGSCREDGSLELHGGGLPDEQLEQGEGGHAPDSAPVGKACGRGSHVGQCAVQPPSRQKELPVTESGVLAAQEERQCGDLLGLDEPLDGRGRQHDLLQRPHSRRCRGCAPGQRSGPRGGPCAHRRG